MVSEESRVVGMDLAGKPDRPTGWALLQGKIVEVKELFSDKDLLKETINVNPFMVAIDAPLTLPKSGVTRKADRDMRKLGYPVFPPLYPAMKTLTFRGMRLAQMLRKRKIEVIEVHPASTRKALFMPVKDWGAIREVFVAMGLQKLKKALSSHEVDAVTAALTAYFHIRGSVEKIGDDVEGYIVVPTKQPWREVKL